MAYINPDKWVTLDAVQGNRISGLDADRTRDNTTINKSPHRIFFPCCLGQNCTSQTLCSSMPSCLCGSKSEVQAVSLSEESPQLPTAGLNSLYLYLFKNS